MAAGPDRTIDYGDVSIETFVTGTWRENCYLVTDRGASETAVIDPGDEPERLIAYIEDRGYRVALMLLTHAYYFMCATTMGSAPNARKIRLRGRGPR